MDAGRTRQPNKPGKRRGGILMHCLIMGATGIDHIDHDGLNNQRSNLRQATQSQNGGNQRPHLDAASPYKGVQWSSEKRRWVARIILNRHVRHLGYFWSELEAAYVYDAAARELFGEFANPNFPDEPTRAMRDEWERTSAEQSFDWSANRLAWWAQRETETRVCTVCGREYQSRSTKPSFFCGGTCKKRAYDRRRKERELEGRLF